MLLIYSTLWFPIFVMCQIISVEGANFYEGDQCTSEIDGREGECSSIYNCPWALSAIRTGQKVHTCSFNGKTPIICCPSEALKERNETSTEKIINKGATSVGELSRRKCAEYNPPPPPRPAFVFAAVGGVRALSQEFPHMALLGYGTEAEKEWKCGGSLISLRHILTAAHCLYSRDLGDVKFVRLGDLDIADDQDIADPQDYYVKKSIPHPDFDSASLKHDIAILELNDEVRITSFVKPACLFVDGKIHPEVEITATGWGITEFAGDQCSIQSEKMQGSCVSIGNCSWALTRIKQRQRVHLCSYKGKIPIICCPSGEKINNVKPLVGVAGNFNPSTNLSLPKESLSSTAWSERKCEEYYPPREGVFIAGVGGEKSLAQEFPHMAILGYGSENQKEWKCGGSLITHQHILTAAHCLYSRDLGDVKYVRLGDLDILNNTDEAEPQDFNVKTIIQHPNYDRSKLKHDIAILVLDRPVRVTDFVKPACLFPGGVIADHEDITATGWGITEFAGQPSSHLIKVRLRIVGNADCRHQYRRASATGDIDDEFQVCAGSADAEKIIDTCEGDSGGPLQFVSFTRRKHYFIIGVTSFGKACGITRSAGVYTRVSSHLPWIQSVVLNNV
ncbi:venom serine protease Bi-VSP-like isoform X1 [Harmonia axyridis]|uniref:venom serine protease Bi-VSP-like isoform X1 n=1 Tax=Harmonia axyridis TaxID=115357 RepID=UPI001E275DCB|nr:venom serine protease Bi-VSP-like isoform X1 [Harmonia axyridis]